MDLKCVSPGALRTGNLGFVNSVNQKWLRIGTGLALAFLAMNIALTFRNTRQLQRDAEWVTHTHRVLLELVRLQSLLTDAETGQRGFIITGEDRYLEPYTRALEQLDDATLNVERLTQDNQGQKRHIPKLLDHIQARLELLRKNLDRFRSEGFDATRQAMIVADAGKREMDAIREIVSSMVQSESELLLLRRQRSERTYFVAMASGLMSGLLALSLVGAMFWLIQRHLAQRTLSEMTLAEQGERLRTTLASIGDAVITTDTAGHVTGMNGVAETLTGWKLQDARGQPLETVFVIVNESTWQPVENPAMRALKDGTIVGLANHTVLISKDGSERPIDDSAAPIRCKLGEIVGCVLVFRDISDRWKQETALRESEEQFRRAIEEAPIPVIMIADDGEVLQVSKSWTELTGFQKDDAATFQSWLAKSLGGQGEDLRSAVYRVFKHEGFVRGVESEVVTRHGQVRTWSFSASSPGTLRDGRRFIVGMAEDITSRKAIEISLRGARDAAEQANRSRGEFLANMSHEIRTPMTAILGHADILSDHLQDPDDLQCIDTIRRNGKFLLQIINDILDLSKIDAGKLEIRKERVRPEIVLGDIRSLMDVRAREKHLPLEISFDGKIPAQIETDPVRLRQILLNLIGNAIKFTDQGHVRVIASHTPAANQVSFEIADTGVGIHAEDMPRLFQPFTQIDASSTRIFGGTGLGLVISRRLAQALGGDIVVDSEPGLGSTFRLTIDCGAISDVALIEPSLNQEPLAQGTIEDVCIDGCILVVDDRRDIRYLAQHFVERAGGRVVTATNGREAVEILANSPDHSSPIDLVLMDMQMPVMDGYAAAAELRQRGFTKPIIALTANAMQDDRDKCLQAGCNDYATKPLDGPLLIRMISDYLTGARK